MNLTADQIARTFIAASNATGVDFEHISQGVWGGVYGGKVVTARAAICFGLACVNDREPEAWSVQFGWHANEDRARQALAAKRADGLLRGPVIEAVSAALGIDPSAPLDRDNRVAAARRSAAAKKRADARAAKAAAKAEATRKKHSSLKRIAEAEARCKQTAEAARAELKSAPTTAPNREPKAPAPKPRNVTSETEAAKLLLGSIPASRVALTSATVQGSAGPRHIGGGNRGEPSGNKVTKVQSPADIAAMRDSLIRRPVPKRPEPEALPAGIAPLETAFMGEFERRIVLRCQQLQKGGSGLNDIRRDLLTEMQVKKSPDWIARACVTVLKDNAS